MVIPRDIAGNAEEEEHAPYIKWLPIKSKKVTYAQKKKVSPVNALPQFKLRNSEAECRW